MARFGLGLGGNRPAARGGALALALRNAASTVYGNGWANPTSISSGLLLANSWVTYKNNSGAIMTELDLVFSGAMLDATSEVDAPFPVTVTAGIRYPISSGTPQQVLFAGSPSMTVQPGTYPSSDRLTLTTPIPIGGLYQVRTCSTVTSGQGWPRSNGAVNPGTGWANSYGGTTDLTLSTVNTGMSSSGVAYAPIAVRTPTPTGKVVLAVLGNSLVAGQSDASATLADDGAIGGYLRGAAGVCPAIGFAVGGTLAFQQAVAGKMTRRIAQMVAAGVTHALIEWSFNDIDQNRTSAQVMASISSIASQIAAAGIKVIYATGTFRITSAPVATTRFASSAQAASTAKWSGPTSVRGIVNDWLRAKTDPNIFDVIDLQALETSKDSGIFIDYTANTDLTAPTSATVAGGSTTTVIQSSYTGFTNNLSFPNSGALLFTSGALSGTWTTVTSNTSGGAITVPTALASAPVAGDTFLVYQNTSALTGDDGLHFNSAGAQIIKKIVRAKLLTY